MGSKSLTGGVETLRFLQLLEELDNLFKSEVLEFDAFAAENIETLLTGGGDIEVVDVRMIWREERGETLNIFVRLFLGITLNPTLFCDFNQNLPIH